MENIVAQQLNKLLNLTGDTPSKLAVKVKMKRLSVSNWTSEGTWMPLKQVYKLLEVYPGLRVEWLMLGRGEPFENNADDDACIVNEEGSYYNKVCRDCLRLEGKIDLLQSDIARKDLRIEHLVVEVNKPV